MHVLSVMCMGGIFYSFFGGWGALSAKVAILSSSSVIAWHGPARRAEVSFGRALTLPQECWGAKSGSITMKPVKLIAHAAMMALVQESLRSLS